MDVSDPAVVGPRAAARVEAWLEVRLAEEVRESVELMPASWRRDPFWRAVLEDVALRDVTDEFQQRCEREPGFLARLLHDG